MKVIDKVLTPKEAMIIVANGGKVTFEYCRNYEHKGYIYMRNNNVLVVHALNQEENIFQGSWDRLKEVVEEPDVAQVINDAMAHAHAMIIDKERMKSIKKQKTILRISNKRINILQDILCEDCINPKCKGCKLMLSKYEIEGN
jgi:thiamine biosynthesis protein ThiC